MFNTFSSSFKFGRAINKVSAGPAGSVFLSPSSTTNISVVAQSPFSSGGNSYNFNGSSSFITLNGNESWAFGTGDFTIEWFQYETDNSAFPRIFSIGAYPSASIACSIEGGTFYAWFSNASNFGTAVPYKNSWVHFAIVRKNNKLSVFKNGVQRGSSLTNTTNITNSHTTLYFGVENGGNTGTFFGGYLTNIRLVKGLGVYSGNFTVPTSNLSLISDANPFGGSNTEAIPEGFTKLLLIP